VCRTCTGTASFSGSPSSTTAPEADGHGEFSPQRVQTLRWTSTATSRLLLEAGLGTFGTHFGGSQVPGLDLHDFIRVVDQCTAGCPANANIAGLTYRSPNWASNVGTQVNWRSSASYITGAHSMKVGYAGAFHIYQVRSFTNSQNLVYRVNNGVPNQLTQTLNTFKTRNRTRSDAVYLHDQSTFGRWTVSGALRVDYARSYFPEQQIGPTRFLPTAVILPRADGVTGYKDSHRAAA
jgi:hypothetical protein